MRITAIQVTNFRSFEDSGTLPLDSINVLLGPNNAGKSSLIRAVGLIQDGLPLSPDDVRLRAERADVALTLDELPGALEIAVGRDGVEKVGTLRLVLMRGGSFTMELQQPQQGRGLARLPSTEPNHFLVPYLSKRKVVTYDEVINQAVTTTVGPDLRNLAAKLARLANPAFPASARYTEACEAILGFLVTVIPAPNGQQPGVYVSTTEAIPIDAMGEGVPNIVGLLADLALAEGKFFLVEEPENDVHPQALKALLELVVKSSEQNQFLVSTHSNVVVRHLGAAERSTLYYIDSKRGQLPPVATARRVSDDPADRIEVLVELGYELYDFDLWEGWLILEESSAERIIRDYLVRWFAPKLSRVRTVAVNGTGNVEPAFEDFNRLFRFTHLEQLYRNRAWVIVDGDKSGREVVERLKATYGGSWDESRFRTWSEPAFENHYPQRFSAEVHNLANTLAGQQRQTAKRELLRRVLTWIDSDTGTAKDEFAASAAEVIEALRDIEQTLFGSPATPKG